MNNISEEAMRATFRETVQEINTSPFLNDLMNSAVDRMTNCKDLATLSIKDKMFYAVVMGFSMQRCLQRQFILDLSKEKLHERIDGYEVIDEEGNRNLILTEKDKLKTDEDAIEYAKQTLGVMGAKFSSVRKLSDFELQKHKKEILINMGN